MAHDWLDCFRDPRLQDTRRKQPRIPAAGAFCTEIADDHERYAMISDVSPTGLRLHRPYGGARTRTVQLEFDLPGLDEVIWARGVVCFDRVWRAADGQVLQTSGIELTRAAGRHLGLLREFAAEHAGRFGRYAERRASMR